MGRRPAAPAVRAVDDVVVDQRAGLDQLERGAHPDDRVAVGAARRAAAGRGPAAPQELRPQPLAAVRDELDQQIDEIGQPRVDRDHLGPPPRQFGG